MKNSFSIKGKKILVSGGMGYLGRTVIKYFSAKGAKIVYCDIVDPKKAAMFEMGLRRNHELKYIKCDVTRSNEVQKTVDAAVAFLGGLDALVNTAAYAKLVYSEEMTDNQWDETVRISLYGCFYMCRSVFKYLKEKGGAIVNVASIAGIIGLPRGTTHHSAAKAGMLGMTRSLALEWAKYRIRVNALAPGQFDTGPLREVMKNKENAENILRNIPMGRIGTSKEVADAIFFLISDASAYITGHTLVIDGGTTIS